MYATLAEYEQWKSQQVCCGCGKHHGEEGCLELDGMRAWITETWCGCEAGRNKKENLPLGGMTITIIG